jgi:hypothetical protein
MGTSKTLQEATATDNDFSIGSLFSERKPALPDKGIEMPASRIPSGTAYFLASFETNAEYALNVVRLAKGVPKILRSAGDQAFRGTVVSEAGDRIIVNPDPRNASFDIWSLRRGTQLPLKKERFKGYQAYRFGSFSPEKRYVSYSWLKVDESGKTTNRYFHGVGIYDFVSQQRWEQPYAMFPVWNVSGDSLIFGRYVVPGFDSLKDLRFFRWSVRRLNDPAAEPTVEPITPAVAERLLGKWYIPLLKRLLQRRHSSSDLSLANLSGSVSIAPGNHGNRGAVLTDTRNGIYNPEVAHLPHDLDLEWTTTYLDARGRAVVHDPSPALLRVLSWSRDGERVYGFTCASFSFRTTGSAFICFWVRTGKYALIPFEAKLGTVLAYIED